MKTLDTLVDDIYSLFDGHECSEDNLKAFSDNIAKVVKDRLHNADRKSHGTLRMSSVGRPCDRQIWYGYKGVQGEELQPHTKLKFMFGDVIEELLLFLVKESGHVVTDEQKEVELSGIKGHMDCKIDGEVVDIKSASSFAFKKFSEGTLPQNDAFGYIAQISGYAQAEGDFRGHFLAMDKQNGHICLYTPPKLIDAEDRIDHMKRVVDLDEPPARCYLPKPDGKAGNLKLDVNCSYCAHKHTCWADANNGEGIRTFIYSTGPRFLTKVARVPDVMEVK